MTITFFHTLLFAIWMGGIPVLDQVMKARIDRISKEKGLKAEKNEKVNAWVDMIIYYVVGLIILIYPAVMKWLFE